MFSYVNRSPTEREVHCRCERCGNICDGLYQYSGTDGWSPDPKKTLDVLGWIAGDEDSWYCSKYCRDVYAQMVKREDPVKPVVKLSSPTGPAQRAYSTK